MRAPVSFRVVVQRLACSVYGLFRWARLLSAYAERVRNWEQRGPTEASKKGFAVGEAWAELAVFDPCIVLQMEWDAPTFTRNGCAIKSVHARTLTL